MIKKKICMLGTFGVGKTSLVRRFVHGIYEERYVSTFGAKIDRKTVVVDGTEVVLLIWDLAGEDERQRLITDHMRGASGLLYVADGTRSETVQSALGIAERAGEKFPGLPSLMLVNKSDLRSEWEVDMAKLPEVLRPRETSALNGEHVEEAFVELASAMVQNRGGIL